MKAISRLAALAAVLALSGCMSEWAGVRNHWALNDDLMQQVKPGMTQADVVKLVGNPPWKLAMPAKGEEIWSYRYLHYHTRMRANMVFDTKGVLKSRTLEYDMNAYSRV